MKETSDELSLWKERQELINIEPEGEFFPAKEFESSPDDEVLIHIDL